MSCDNGRRVLVACSVCHISYDVSARTNRDIKAGRVEPRCEMHRRRKARVATVNASYRRFWLDRFTMEEIVVMANAITAYLPSSARQPQPAGLVASAQRREAA